MPKSKKNSKEKRIVNDNSDSDNDEYVAAPDSNSDDAPETNRRQSRKNGQERGKGREKEGEKDRGQKRGRSNKDDLPIAKKNKPNSNAEGVFVDKKEISKIISENEIYKTLLDSLTKRISDSNYDDIRYEYDFNDREEDWDDEDDDEENEHHHHNIQQVILPSYSQNTRGGNNRFFLEAMRQYYEQGLDEDEDEAEEVLPSVADELGVDKFYKLANKKDKKFYQLELEKIRSLSNIASNIPFKYRILQLPLSIQNKATIMDKFNMLEACSLSSGEYTKLTKWINNIMKVPFGKYIDMPVSIDNGEKAVQDFIQNVYKRFNQSIYGQYDAKDKLLQVITKWITNPTSSGNVIALHGAPGIGKTSLIKDGLAKALNKPFSFMALGGATDSSVLTGHSYTYEGSTWGRIIEMIIECQCMNPIIFFDELDKVSETKIGEEIIGVLMHLIDPSQNTTFHDRYFSGIDFDLSKALFIFSFNDEKKVNNILQDRISKIKLEGFCVDDKLIIAKKYIIPDINKNVGFDGCIFDDNVIRHIISKYTNEDGVRKLREKLEMIVLRVNLLRFISSINNNTNNAANNTANNNTSNAANNEDEIQIKYRIQNFKLPLKLDIETTDKLLELSGIETLHDSSMKMAAGSIDEKILLARKYIIPTIARDNGVSVENVRIGDDVLRHIVDKYTDESIEGKRLIDYIEYLFIKLNFLRHLDSKKLEEGYGISCFTFPFTVEVAMIDKLLNVDETREKLLKNSVMKLASGSIDEKILLARKYIIPTIARDNGVAPENVLISDDVLRHIVEKYTDEYVEGKRLIDYIEYLFIKLGFLRHLDSKKLEEGYGISAFAFPFTVEVGMIDKLLNVDETREKLLEKSALKLTKTSADEKVLLARKYIIPSVARANRMAADSVILSDDVLHYIIENYVSESKEEYSLKSHIEQLFIKVGLLQHMDNTKLARDYGISSLKFPFTIDKNMVDKLLNFNGKIPDGIFG